MVCATLRRDIVTVNIKTKSLLPKNKSPFWTKRSKSKKINCEPTDFVGLLFYK